MKQTYINLLLSWPKKSRSKNALNHPELLIFLDKSFPTLDDLSSKIRCLLEDGPYCIICGNPVKLRRNKTCSRLCRDKEQEPNQALRVEKHKKTMLEKYGVDNIGKLPSTTEKRNATMLKKYGALVSEKSLNSIKSRTDKFIEKSKKTMLEKHGVSNPGQLSDHREKCRATMLKKYGVDSYYKSSEFASVMEERRYKVYDNYCPAEITLLNITDDEEKQKMFSSPNKRITFNCTTCENTETIPSETFKWRINQTGTPCRTCSGISQGSLKETEIAEFIKNDLGLNIQRNARILPEGKEIDIYIPILKIGIEFDGLYWHNDLRIDKNYHKRKQIEAEEMGIRLIHIFEDEWDRRKQVVKSRLSNLAQKSVFRVQARKCTIKTITLHQERQFLDTNHLQGYVASSVKLGLFYDGQLVSVMTFSKPNLSKGQKKQEGRWELLRFCSLANYHVMGGANKLFSYFVKEFNPMEVLSFADRRWSAAASVYNLLGFDYVGETSVNYWYFKAHEGIRYHRFALRKNKNDDQSLTEYQNRLAQGYLRIWDCGSSKWIWKRAE